MVVQKNEALADKPHVPLWQTRNNLATYLHDNTTRVIYNSCSASVRACLCVSYEGERSDNIEIKTSLQQKQFNSHERQN